MGTIVWRLRCSSCWSKRCAGWPGGAAAEPEDYAGAVFRSDCGQVAFEYTFCRVDSCGVDSAVCHSAGLQPGRGNSAYFDAAVCDQCAARLPAELLWKVEHSGANRSVDRGALPEDLCFFTVGDASRYSHSVGGSIGTAFGGTIRVDRISKDECGTGRDGGLENYSSVGVSARDSSSSIAISINSAESKTSPHDWHSTNSASSSRATILTIGCLHLAFIGGGYCECYGFCPSQPTLSTEISRVFRVKFVAN